MNYLCVAYTKHDKCSYIYTVDTRYLHIGYVDVFVKSRILSLYILYIFIPYKSTFVSQHFAYLDMF